MCVLALAFSAHPRWRLVVAGNRDEAHARPAAALHRWPESGILAGQDLQSGGTWLGVAESGRFGVVTNLRTGEGASPLAPSRGLLLRDLVAGYGAYADLAAEDLAVFNPLNLLTLIDGNLAFWRNRPAPGRRALGPGLYGLSNGTLDEAWPKTVALKAALRDWLDEQPDDPRRLLDTLRDETASIFVRNAVYGTRCSTVVAVDADGLGLIVERRFDAEGARTGDSELGFRWPRVRSTA